MATHAPQKLTSVQNPKMLVGTWIFTVLWCGFTFTMFGIFAFAARDLIGAAITGIFALLGVVMLYGAVKTTLEYVKFGRIHLVLARPPETGGKLEARLELPADMRGQVSAELACVQVVWSRGSKGGTSRSESDNWTRKQTFPIRRGATGCEVLLAMDVPGDRPASSLPQEGPPEAMFDVMNPGPGVEIDHSYYRWEVRIKADVPGVDLERMFRPRIAAGRGAAQAGPAPAVPLTPPVVNVALEQRLDARKSARWKLAVVCFLMGFVPFVLPFAIAGIAVGLAGCPMGWSNEQPPTCLFAGIDWGKLMAGAFDLMFVAAPAGVAGSVVVYFAGQLWLDRKYLTNSAAGAGRFTSLVIGAAVVGFFVYLAWQFARPFKTDRAERARAPVEQPAPAGKDASNVEPAAVPAADWESALARAAAAASQDEAAPLLDGALSAVQKQHGLEHPAAAAVLFRRAGVYRSQGNRAQQEKALLRALAILESHPVDESKQALGAQGELVDKEIVARELGDYYWDRRRYADAYLYYDRAYRYVAEISLPDGERNRRLARNSAGRMVTACTQSNWEVAEAAMKELKERIVNVDAETRRQLEHWIRTGEPRLAARKC